jgi:cell division protease FtsH
VAVKRTRFHVPGAASGTRFSGDHLNALCRAIARFRLRQGRTDPTTPADVERALTEWHKQEPLTPSEERVVATHEAGHAVCTLFTEHSPPIERISLMDDVFGALGYVMSQESQHKYIQTQNQLLDRLCVLMGGREAEALLLDDISLGSQHDLQMATWTARVLVEASGMGGDEIGACNFWEGDNAKRRDGLSDSQKHLLDRRVRDLLEEARRRAAVILRENRGVIETIRDLLLKHKVMEAKTFAEALRAVDPKAAANLDRPGRPAVEESQGK